MMKSLSIILGISVLLVACKKEETSNGGVNPPAKGDTDVLVLNEGNFMWGNASITAVHSLSESASQGVFEAVNDFPLGDVAQSAILHDDLLYVVVNNSSKIEVLDAESYASVKTISGFTSPRYICVVEETPLTAWVSDLYSDYITEVDLNSGSKIRTISAEGWTEKMIDIGVEVLVHGVTDSVLLVIDQLTGSVNEINSFDNENVVDLVAGESLTLVLTTKGIWQLSHENLNTIKLYDFLLEKNASKLTVDWENNKVYYRDTDIFRVNLDEKTETMFYESKGRSFYGLAWNSSSSELIVTDAKDYVQQGAVIVLNTVGEKVFEVEAGINPQFILIP